MSEQEAELIFREFIEYKFMWHKEDGFPKKYLLSQALEILGDEKIKIITLELKKIWND